MEKNYEVVERFIEDNQRYSEGTCKIYRYNISKVLRDIDKSYDKVNLKDIRKWMYSQYHAGIKASTILTKLRTLHTFYLYCEEEKLINKCPIKTSDYPKVSDRLPQAITSMQLNQLRELVKDKKRNSAIIEIAYSTGIRIAELVSIRISDINFDKRQILILGKGSKERIVIFSSLCACKIRDYLATRNDNNVYLIINELRYKNSKMGIRAVQFIFEELSRTLGYKVNCRALRHTFATHLAQNGMPIECIQTLLGHDSIDTTNIYARLCLDALKNKYDK